MIVERRVCMPGVHIPVTKEIYGSVLDELATMNIECKETTEKF